MWLQVDYVATLRHKPFFSFAVLWPGDGRRGAGHQQGDLLRHPHGPVLQRPCHGWKPTGRNGYRGSRRQQPTTHFQGIWFAALLDKVHNSVLPVVVVVTPSFYFDKSIMLSSKLFQMLIFPTPVPHVLQVLELSSDFCCGNLPFHLLQWYD